MPTKQYLRSLKSPTEPFSPLFLSRETKQLFSSAWREKLRLAFLRVMAESFSTHFREKGARVGQSRRSVQQATLVLLLLRRSRVSYKQPSFSSARQGLGKWSLEQKGRRKEEGPSLTNEGNFISTLALLPDGKRGKGKRAR